MRLSNDTCLGEPQLLPHHAELIRRSAVSEEVALARGYRSVTTKAAARQLGFGSSQLSVPALVVPIWSVSGELGTYQLRPDQPRVMHGKPIKYETPRGTRMMIDVPAHARPSIGNPSIPLVVTEGARKADAAVSAGLACVDLLGVWNWRGRNEHGGAVALPDWESVALRDRLVYLAFDSDVMSKIEVAKALHRLSAFLRARGAEVRPIYLPSMADGSKQGLDDFLAGGGSSSDLLAYAEQSLRPLPPGAGDGAERFIVANGRICEVRVNGQGEDPSLAPLCNFSAEIIEEVVADDGAGERADLVIAGALANGTLFPTIRIQRNRFAGMRWPFECWGVRAIVEPGMGAADKLRAAIQSLSQGSQQRRVYEHSGWREIDGEWVFLHADGAIGAAGAIDNIDVDLPKAAALIRLPEPPEGDDLHVAIRASLSLLDIAPDAVSAVVLGSAYRAALLSALPADFGVFIVGPTGSFKSELASLVMRHLGPGFDRLHLPVSWSATPNFIERALFDFKDVPVVIDDFAPANSAREADRLHSAAERVFRGVGNASGRGRLSADASARPVYPARGLAMATGEDEPRGHSIRARLVVVEVEPYGIDRQRLTQAQESAASGLLAVAFAGYVRWLAPRYGDLVVELRERFTQLRAQASLTMGHARTPDAIANLAIGWDIFLRYASDSGALSGDEVAALWSRVWEGLAGAGERQAAHQADQEPTQRFRELLASVIAAGEAHVASATGGEPGIPERWGWREVLVGTGEHQRNEWRPQGSRVGWVEDDHLYLDLEVALAEVNRLGSATGGGVQMGSKTLAKRMAQRGLLTATEPGPHGGLSVRRNLEGTRRRVHQVRADLVGAEETVQSVQTAPEPARGRSSTGTEHPQALAGRNHGTDFSWDQLESGPDSGTNTRSDERDSRVDRIGRIHPGQTGAVTRELRIW